MSKQSTITVENTLKTARRSETIELSLAALAMNGPGEAATIHVSDASGKEVLCQTLDSDGDGTIDQLIFQADFTAGEKKTFTVALGDKRVYTKEQFKAYGRFVRERYDDFCWENDLVAHRIYGKALEYWKANPLASSTVDVWVKRTSRLVANDWFMVDDYHVDKGEGADFYSAGLSRGCGGNGLWAKNKLWVSKNFITSRQLANGPIRVMFDLDYEPYLVDGVMVSETKRISLDAGHHLTHYRSFYKADKPTALISGAGLKKVEGDTWELNADRGWIAKWEAVEMGMGEQGLALVADPALYEGQAEDELNLLMLCRADEKGAASYWAGFCWDRAGQYTKFDSWKVYVDTFAQGLHSPLKVSLS